MMLSGAAESKLKAWYGPGTWHTNHPSDFDRWYDFVNQYQLDHGFTIDEPLLQEHIERQADCRTNEYLCDIIRERISRAYNILDFLRRTGR